MTDFPDWGICLTQVARVLWSDVGRAPSPAAGPLAGLPAGVRRGPGGPPHPADARAATSVKQIPHFPELVKHSGTRMSRKMSQSLGVGGYVFCVEESAGSARSSRAPSGQRLPRCD